MALAKLLYIRHPRSKDDGTLAQLSRKYEVVCAGSGKNALEVAEQEKPSIIILDSMSLRTSGDRIVRKLKQSLPSTPIIHILPDGETLDSQADATLQNPTPRRLINSVGRFLTKRKEEVLECGPFCMNVARRILVAHGEEWQLTPKQARLVELFLRKPGETIDRKTIMSEVWDTEYVGDTRTLDVHIRWVRQVIEAGDEKPRYLETVRGIGYRLNVHS